jgi:type IV pilus assembly protein PilB
MRVMDASSLLAAQADLQALLKAGLADDGAVVRLLDRLLHWAHALRASDLHFEPYEGIYRIRIRVDGQLQEWLRPPLAVRERVASRIKVLARLDIAEKRLPQDGRLRHQLAAGQWADFRVSTLPTVHGEKLVVRLIDAAPAQLDLDALGYEPEQKAAVVQALARSHGMILVTGPTGAGKTLSMYSCLQQLNRTGVNICTAEDPCEINLAGINQVSIHEKAGRYGTQGGADRAFGVFHAAHQRRAQHPHAPAANWRGGAQRGRQCGADHGPAPAQAPVPALPARDVAAAADDARGRLSAGGLGQRRAGL